MNAEVNKYYYTVTADSEGRTIRTELTEEEFDNIKEFTSDTVYVVTMKKWKNVKKRSKGGNV